MSHFIEGNIRDRMHAGESDCLDVAECLLKIDEMREQLALYENERKKIQNHERVLTCAFCGLEYPPGTPTSNNEALVQHIEVCSQHPARFIREERDQLRMLCAEVYQVVGALSAECNLFDQESTQKVLDNLHAASVGEHPPHESILPYP